jgi:hypothetical protein
MFAETFTSIMRCVHVTCCEAGVRRVRTQYECTSARSEPLAITAAEVIKKHRHPAVFSCGIKAALSVRQHVTRREHR